MARSARISVVLLCLVGLIFIGQGLGLLRGSSFMVGDARWAWIGALLLIAGLVIGVVVSRRGRA